MTDKENKLSRLKKTPEELRKASNALHYEIWMFNVMVISLLSQHPQPGNPQYNALVESFVQHMRNLIEFFYPSDKVRPDTIIASDFFSNPSQWKKKWPDLLRKANSRANKLLAHLTYDRINADKGWEFSEIREIREQLNSLFAKFRNEVPQDRIGEKLKNYKLLSVNDLIPGYDGQVIFDKSFGQTASTGTACTNGIKVKRP
jgi:hypothetical protein